MPRKAKRDRMHALSSAAAARFVAVPYFRPPIGAFAAAMQPGGLFHPGLASFPDSDGANRPLRDRPLPARKALAAAVGPARSGRRPQGYRKVRQGVVGATAVTDEYTGKSQRSKRRIRRYIDAPAAVRQQSTRAGATVVASSHMLQFSDGSVMHQEQGEDDDDATSYYRSNSHPLGNYEERSLRTVASCDVR